MGKKKEGDLRLLKDGVVFGPTDRPGLERLLAAGRIGLTDRVSVRNAEWLPICDFLAGAVAVSAPSASPDESRPAAASAARSKQGDLRAVNGGRIISALTREDIERLRREGRVGDDDLICASGGPWMRVGDFFAPPLESQPVAPPAAIQAPPPTALPPTALPAPRKIPLPIAGKPGPLPARAAPLRPIPVPPPIAGYPLSRAAPPQSRLGDDWFVRVRGVHSAPLKMHHVKALYQAREVTLDNVARHPSWAENDWRPLRSIPEMAGITLP